MTRARWSGLLSMRAAARFFLAVQAGPYFFSKATWPGVETASLLLRCQQDQHAAGDPTEPNRQRDFAPVVQAYAEAARLADPDDGPRLHRETAFQDGGQPAVRM